MGLPVLVSDDVLLAEHERAGEADPALRSAGLAGFRASWASQWQRVCVSVCVDATTLDMLLREVTACHASTPPAAGEQDAVISPVVSDSSLG